MSMHSFANRLSQSPLWQRWQALPARDRLALGSLGLFLAVVLFYVAAWQPARQALAEARGYYQEQRALNAYLEQNADQARQLASSELRVLPADQLQGLVTESARQQGLELESLESASDGRLQVRLPQAASTPLIAWLTQLQEQGVRLDEARLERQGDGQVSASLTLRAGS